MDRTLEQRLSRVALYSFDGKKYLTGTSLSYLLGISNKLLYTHMRRKERKTLLRPELKFGRTNYYSKEQAVSIYKTYRKLYL